MKGSELIARPFGFLVSVLATLAHYMGALDALAGAIWATVPTWYPALAITSSTILPELGTLSVWVPTVGTVSVGLPVEEFEALVVVGALVYVAYLADNGLEKFGFGGNNDG